MVHKLRLNLVNKLGLYLRLNASIIDLKNNALWIDFIPFSLCMPINFLLDELNINDPLEFLYSKYLNFKLLSVEYTFPNVIKVSFTPKTVTYIMGH